MFLSQFNLTELHSCTVLQGTQNEVTRFVLGLGLSFVCGSVHWVSSHVVVSTEKGRDLYIILQLQVDQDVAT